MSTRNIYGKTGEVIREKRPDLTGHHLDIGSSSGGLITLIQEAFKVDSPACDYTVDLMKIEGQKVDIADLNTEPLPYGDRLLGALAFRKEVTRYKTIDSLNREVVAAMNSKDPLLGRTMIVSAAKLPALKT